MGNLKKGIFGLVAFVMIMLVATMSVSAEEISVANTDDLAQKLADAAAGDTLILADGTYSTDLTVDKDITIKGTSTDGTIINGSVILNTEGIEVTLDTLTVTDSATIIDVKATSTLNVNNAKVIYAGYNGTFAANNSDGIWLEKTANGSKVNVVGSTVVAKYAIWVYGEENKVSIDDSTINGWAAIDITNGNVASTTAKNNSVTVNNSDIIGTNVYNGPDDAYGVIVVGGQSNLTLEITKSTVKNEFTVGNNSLDVILFSGAYQTSEETEISIVNSELINNDTTTNSAVISYDTEEIQNGANIVTLYETTVTSENDLVYDMTGDYITFTVDLLGVQSSTPLPNNSVIPENALDPGNIEGYTFEGWYLDADFTIPFDPSVALDADTTIYAKLTEIVEEPEEPTTEPTEPVEPSEPTEPETPVEDVENPSTLDNVELFMGLGVLSVIGLCATAIVLKKRHN